MTTLSFGLRFWHLSHFKALVFDEVYFVKFAQAYLSGSPQFDAHPPLGKYFIALGIWLSGGGYRWMNALIGSLIPLIVIGIVRTLTGWQRSPKLLTFAILAGLFVAIDGLFVTESRYALINIYMVFFGLLGHWLWLQASDLAAPKQSLKVRFYRVLASISLGTAIATKWNGLGYLLSLLVWEIWRTKNSVPKNNSPKNKKKYLVNYLVSSLITAVLISALTYGLIWLPHLWLTQETLGAVHIKLFRFHQYLSASGHSACAKWFTWPLLIKPISYWYEESEGMAYTVNNLGNPALWWLSSSATCLLFIEQILSFTSKYGQSKRTANSAISEFPTAHHARLQPPTRHIISTYLLISYAANWLPWVFVSRCTFIYHYMPAAVFSFMLLAWLLSEWLYSPLKPSLRSLTVKRSRTQRRVSQWGMPVLMLAAIALAFIFWLPLTLGLPLTPTELLARWWLKSWP